MRMKVARIAIVGLGCLFGFGILLVALTQPSPYGPKLVPLRSAPIGSYTWMAYDWGGAVPVQDGTMWIIATTGHKMHNFLYDVTDRLIVGELVNANAIFFNRDRTKLLCAGYSLERSWKWKVVRWLENFPLGKPLAQRINRVEAFWVLNLTNESSEPVGQVSQFPGTSSRFLPAPGFRYGVNMPTTSVGRHELFLCDLERNLMTKMTIRGTLVGWWDAHTLLLHDEGNNFVLQDVLSQQTEMLLGAEATAKWMEQMGLPGSVGDLGWRSYWNGSGYDFFFTLESQKNWGESFLLKLERSDRTLKLVKRDFKFEWQGVWDAAGAHYLYEGESGAPGGGGNGGVYLRDLSDDRVTTLVPPDNGGQYSLARFCGDGVIYMRKKALWWVGLNGSNNAPVFQPAGGRQKPR